MNVLKELRYANRERHREWPGSETIDLSFRTIEFGEEAGEVLGAVKKYTRSLRGIKGSKCSLEDIKDEMGDVLVTLDLLADDLDIDLTDAVVSKFNKTSSKYDLKTRLRCW